MKRLWKNLYEIVLYNMKLQIYDRINYWLLTGLRQKVTIECNMSVDLFLVARSVMKS